MNIFHRPLADNCYSHTSDTNWPLTGRLWSFIFEEIVKCTAWRMWEGCVICLLSCWLWHCTIWQIPFIPIHQNVHRHLNATQRHSWTLEPFSLNHVCPEKKHHEKQMHVFGCIFYFTSCPKNACDVIVAIDKFEKQRTITLVFKWDRAFTNLFVCFLFFN